ncbi:MAG: D-glycero-alpha-D-manno-heptose-7-phosphate kinase [Nocardioidaceae bacterium]|nr:D-glycero-alpha-D-manno-heptose-7-phosphate kinase [Nocardioidaceae bacterium]MEA2716207.1 D-glycero-alpha-D-manno-heptose-7-phosphate kinase [Actinomycetota bacterium]
MILARAPLRLPLGGGGTDLPSYYRRQGGFILAASITKYVYVAVNRPSADDLIRLKYSRSEEVVSVDDLLHDLARPALRHLDVDRNIEISSMADVPAGTGLGSSSTYLVTLLTALLALKRETLTTHELAELSCHLEIDVAGHAAGKQDHYTAAYGGINALEIKPDGTVDVTDAGISITTMEELRNGLVLFFTGLTRTADVILREQVVGTEKEDGAVLDSLDEVKELGYRIHATLQTDDLEAFGDLLNVHWKQKKRRSKAISNPEIDQWYELGRRNGALGGKLVGAGGGGFLLFYCPAEHRHQLRHAMARTGLREMPFDFDHYGAKVLVSL